MFSDFRAALVRRPGWQRALAEQVIVANNMSHPSPHDMLKAMMAQAQGYAEFSMRKIGQVPPTLIAQSPKGPIHFIPSSLADERAKNDFANTSRLVCIAHDVTAAVTHWTNGFARQAR